MIQAGLLFGTKLIDVIGEVVEDKDKRNELNKEVVDAMFDWQKTMLSTTTTPKVDAFVKLLYAFRDVVIPMLRPVGAAAMTAFGLYAHYKGIQIDPVMHGIVDSAFPGWMASRHVTKAEEAKKEAAKPKNNDWPDHPYLNQ
jgi:hypothetical protein